MYLSALHAPWRSQFVRHGRPAPDVNARACSRAESPRQAGLAHLAGSGAPVPGPAAQARRNHGASASVHPRRCSHHAHVGAPQLLSRPPLDHDSAMAQDGWRKRPQSWSGYGGPQGEATLGRPGRAVRS
jgi:hypothetical protein